MRRYRGKHLKYRPKKRGPVVVGTATAVLIGGSSAHAATHKVRPGETLSSIAARYGTTVTALARSNKVSNPNFIVVGRRLRVPGRSGASASGMGRHLVRPGETLSGIALRYGTTLAALRRANDLSNPNRIIAGTRLRVPGGRGRPRGSGPASVVHTVRAGESLWEIAARYETTVRALTRANDLADPSLIVAGQRLRVPTRVVPAPSGGTGRGAVGGLLERHSADHGVDTSLVKAVAWQESGWQQDVVSPAGAIGIMQVMPGTAGDLNASHGIRLNVRKANGNVHLGVMYLDSMLGMMGSERKALAAYYTGPGNVKGALSRIQRAYVRSVEALKQRF